MIILKDERIMIKKFSEFYIGQVAVLKKVLRNRFSNFFKIKWR